MSSALGQKSGLWEQIKRVNASPPPEESVALRVAVLAAVLAAAWSVLSQDVGSPALRVVCVIGIPAGFVLSHVSRHKDRFWLKFALAMAVLAAFANFLATITRITTSGIADVQVPLAELFLWVQFLHSLDVPARRDLLFSLVSSLVLVAVGGVLSISSQFGLWLALWAVAGVATLVLGYRRELAARPPLAAATGRPDRPPPVATRARAVLGAPVTRAALVVVALVAVIGAVVFSVVPSAGGARAFTFPARLPDSVAVPVPGGLSNPSLGRDDPAARGPDGSASKRTDGRESYGYFGFSDRLDTAVRGRPDNTLVMRVRASRPDFWRGQSFDRWDGRTWTLSQKDPVSTLSGSAPLSIPSPRIGSRDTPEFVQTYYVRKSGPNVIFAASVPTEVYFSGDELRVMRDGTLRTTVGIGDGAVYTVISHRPPATPDLLRASGVFTVDPDKTTTPYLQLPPMPQRISDLAASVTASAATNYDKVVALEQWMAANTRYSLDIPKLPKGADAVDTFLFDTRVGFCEQIGSSLVVMLRSLGIPARLAVGYAAGERNPFTGLYEVRAKDAHSWAEVFFPTVGWQAFDPTAHVPLAGDASFTPASAGAAHYLSVHLPKVPKRTDDALLVLVALLVVGAGVHRFRRDARRRAADAARPWADAFAARLEAEGALRGRPRGSGETLREYVLALRHGVLPDARLTAVADVLDLERFSGNATEPEARARAETIVAEASEQWPAPDRRRRHLVGAR